VIQVSGRDAQDYLQRMTTVQFKTLTLESVVPGAFLTGRGGVVALGSFRRTGTETFQFVISQAEKAKVLDHIEKFHFTEQLDVEDLSSADTFFGCWSEEGSLASTLGINPSLPTMTPQRVRWGGIEFVAWKDLRRSSLFWIQLQQSFALEFIKSCQKSGHSFLGRQLFEFFRLEAAVPLSGVELNEKDIILEGNFDESVARNKGCYPGQEVVERIFTYGQVNRKLQRVTLWGEINSSLKLPMAFSLEGKEVGELVSMEQSPDKQGFFVGLMFVKKEFWNSQDLWDSQSGLRARLG
ncbi:MAG: YgfZ/GcvT domain-containing protein, partial [Deltaproteobacteria bacterium]